MQVPQDEWHSEQALPFRKRPAGHWVQVVALPEQAAQVMSQESQVRVAVLAQVPGLQEVVQVKLRPKDIRNFGALHVRH